MPLQYLFRNWLQNAAKEKLFEAARQAAQEQMAGGPSHQEPDGERPCDVGLVFSLAAELGGLEDLLAGVVKTHARGFVLRGGGLKGRSVVLAEAGPGLEKAALATQVLISGHQPKWVVAAGFASGLQGELKRGDLVMADAVAFSGGGELLIDLKMPPEARDIKGLHVGKLLTVDRALRRASEKGELGQQHAALAADGMSFAVAEVCRQEKIPFLSVRVIRAAVDDELPPDVDLLTRKKTTAGRMGAAFGALVNRPSSVKDMLQLKEDALIASDRLAKFLSGVIVQLNSFS
jgi:nucleoside phosphorylase